MSEEQQSLSGEEKEERELEEAEKQFEEENKIIAAQQSGEPTKEETAEQNQRILAALGFKPYHDAGVTKYSIRVMNVKIGVTFNETNPLGKVWAYYIPEGDEEKKFFKNGKLAEHPLIQKYRAIQEGKEPMPEISVTGKVIEKRGKAIKVEIEENGEIKQIFFGQGAVMKDKDGHFIPAGFSKSGKDKEGKEHDAKMDLPRDIRLPDYETQLSQVPTTDAMKEQEEGKEKMELPKKPDEKAKTDLQPTDKSTLAEIIAPKESEGATTAEGEKPTVDYYVNLIGEITAKVGAEERIETRERGYAINMVFNAITRDTRTALIAELKNGGDHEES